MPRKIDLTGQRFGRLTVMYEAEPKYTSGGNRKVAWHCKCDCGNEKDVASGDLKSGHTQSCGCYNKEIVKELMHLQNKKYNKYDLQTQEYGIGYTTKGESFIFDKSDFDLIYPYCWTLKHGYCYAKTLDGSGKYIYMHDVVMNTLYVDHISGVKTDNRKANLRTCENPSEFYSYNNRNTKLAKNNTSGHRGVTWRKDDQVWSAQIKVNYKTLYLGDYLNIDDAIRARKEAEEEYYGEWSFDNSQKIAKERNLIEEVI